MDNPESTATHAESETPGYTTVPLRYPVTHDGQKVSALRIRAPKVRDNLAAEKSGGIDAEKEIRQFSNLCEVAPEVIESLYLYDYKKLQDAYRDFLS